MSAETVGESTKQAVTAVRQVGNPETLLALLYWEEAYHEALRSYWEEVVPLFAQRFNKEVSEGVRWAAQSWLDERRLVATSLKVRGRELSLAIAPYRLEVKASLPADGPQPGDIRSVFGRAQVYVDGHWHILGDRCEP